MRDGVPERQTPPSSVIALNAAYPRAGGGTADAPELPELEWTNPATGEIRKVPAGIDPGWDHNPGRHRTLGIHRRDAERSEAILAGRALETVPAPARLRDGAEASAGLVYLPSPVADKQWRRHGPGQKRPNPKRTVPARWWADIQAIIDSIVPVRQPNGRWRYDDVARGRRLIVDRDAQGRLVIVSYQPRGFGDPPA